MAVNDIFGVVMNSELENITIEASSATTPEEAIEEIQSGKSLFKLFGSIYKALKGCITTSKIANNLATTLEGFALDARQGKALKDGQDAINTNLAVVDGGVGTYNGWAVNWDYTRLTKTANNVTLQGLFIPASFTNYEVAILSIPEGFRPTNKNVPIKLITNVDVPCSARIQPDGVIKLFTAVDGSVVPWVGINATWCIK